MKLLLRIPKKIITVALSLFITKPYQSVKNFDNFNPKEKFLQKWRGHHPSVDKNGASVIYEEASAGSTVCAMPYTGIR